MKLPPDSIVHDFQGKLNRSHELSDEGDWVNFYKRLWPDVISMIRIDKDSQWQRWGVDRMLLLPSGRQITIDEKKRDTAFDDFLCEEWSNLERGKIGWTLDETKRCDLIAYAIVALKKCYLLPFELLRITAKINLEQWKKERFAYPKDAPNDGYTTRNCAVSWNRLFRDMQIQMHRQFGAARLELPPVVEIDANNQLNFMWEK